MLGMSALRLAPSLLVFMLIPFLLIADKMPLAAVKPEGQ